MAKRKPIILFVFIFIILIVFEIWIHEHDQYGIMKKEYASIYMIKSLFPIKEYLEIDGIRVLLPYGVTKVNEYSGIGFSIFVNRDEWNKKMNIDYEFIDDLGSSHVWRDNAKNKLIFVTHVQRGLIDYWIINIKPY
jgi:hypothetical protein